MNRAIGITAAVVAFVLGAFQAWVAIQLPELASTYADATRGMEHYTVSLARFVVWLRVEAALSAVAALALIVGGSMLITRNQVGRTLVVLGCLVVVAHASVGWVAAAQMNHWFTVMGVGEEGLRWFDTPNRTSIVLMSVALPVITGISLLHPAVRRRFDLPETAETAL